MKRIITVLGLLVLCSCGTAKPYEPTLTYPVYDMTEFHRDASACREWATPTEAEDQDIKITPFFGVLGGVVEVLAVKMTEDEERPAFYEDRVDVCMKNKGYPIK